MRMSWFGMQILHADRPHRATAVGESTPNLPGLERHLAGDRVRLRIDSHDAGGHARPDRVIADGGALAALSRQRNARDDLVRCGVEPQQRRLLLVGRQGPDRAEPLDGPVRLAGDVLEDGLGSVVD